jgi:hypothetical protein
VSTLSGVSRRITAIYQRYYEERERQRFENLYKIFDTMAAFVDAAELGATLDIDYFCLAEVVRSYFLDAIRYKEYHFDPKVASEYPAVLTKLAELGLERLEDVDPLSAEWTELVHTTVNINASKVAAYTAKWILRHKPITVLNTDPELFGDGLESKATKLSKPIPYLASVNENFALQSALFALEIDANEVCEKKIAEILYCFRFRSFDESSYFMILSRDYLLSDTRGSPRSDKRS